MNRESSTDVVVVGGGMAGISATSLLVKSGLKVVLVEAADYLGGRVKQVQGFEGWPPVDVGGEMIHGCETITYRLAEENNWETEILGNHSSKPDVQAEWVYLDGKLYAYGSNHPDIVAAVKAHSDFMHCNIKQNKQDFSASEYFVRHPELTRNTVCVFETIFCQTEAVYLDSYGSFEQGDFETLWRCGEGNYRIKNSQEQLVKYYIDECRGAVIKLNWQANEIDYTTNSGDSLKVTVTNQNGETLRCKAVMVCVPLTVLKDKDIHFKPELPEDKKVAIKALQMHTGLKITCRFSQRFWPPQYSLLYNCTTGISQVWMYTNINKETGDECHIVTGFQTADLAARKAHLTAEEVKTIFINDLDQIFANESTSTPASKYFIDFVYYHWSSNPFVRAAYSSPSINARGSREILARPVENLVFFAGEATRSMGDCGTVSGAIESGIKSAKEIVNNLTINVETCNMNTSENEWGR